LDYRERKKNAKKTMKLLSNKARGGLVKKRRARSQARKAAAADESGSSKKKLWAPRGRSLEEITGSVRADRKRSIATKKNSKETQMQKQANRIV